MPFQILCLLIGFLTFCACSSDPSTDSTPDGDESGVTCEADTDCPEGFVCLDGRCRIPCDKDADCPAVFPLCVPPGVCTADTDTPLDGDDETDGEVEDLEIDTDGDTDSDRDEESVDNETDGDLDDDEDRDVSDNDPPESDPPEHEEETSTDGDFGPDGDIEDWESDTTDLDLDAPDGEMTDTDGSDGDVVDSSGEISDGEEDFSETDAFEAQLCSSGGCCEDGWTLPAGVLCNDRVDNLYRCMEDYTCQGRREHKVLRQFCSGTSPSCDGPIIPSDEWLLSHIECQGSQYCLDGECVDAPETCCECDDDDGPCCYQCRFIGGEDDYYPNKECEFLGYEFSCEDSEDNERVFFRRQVRHCTGESALCNAEPEWSPWGFYQECFGETFCYGEYCIPYECQWQTQCNGPNHYCRDGYCTYTDFEECLWDPCAEGTYCHPEFLHCFPEDIACENDLDCQGNPVGGSCDTESNHCYSTPHCDVEIDNCRSGTECRHLDELLGYEGDYCTGCEEDSDCYPGLHCEKRLILPDVCVP